MQLTQTLSIAALLVAAVSELPLATSQASAQTTPQPDDIFSFDDAMTNGNTTGATLAEESDTTFVFVMIFPYTAETAQAIEG